MPDDHRLNHSLLINIFNIFLNVLSDDLCGLPLTIYLRLQSQMVMTKSDGQTTDTVLC